MGITSSIELQLMHFLWIQKADSIIYKIVFHKYFQIRMVDGPKSWVKPDHLRLQGSPYMLQYFDHNSQNTYPIHMSHPNPYTEAHEGCQRRFKEFGGQIRWSKSKAEKVQLCNHLPNCLFLQI